MKNKIFSIISLSIIITILISAHTIAITHQFNIENFLDNDTNSDIVYEDESNFTYAYSEDIN